MVRKLICWFLGLGLATFLLLTWTGFGGLWWSTPSAARVIDAETKQPVAGAIVLANWELKGPEGVGMQQVAVQEVTTDAQGTFLLAGWSPQFRANGGSLRAHAPTVRIFQRDYLPLVVRSEPAKRLSKIMRLLGQRSLIGHDTIQLHPARGSTSQMAHELRMFQLSLDFLYSGGQCQWRRAPRTVAAMHMLKTELRGEEGAVALIAVDDIARSPECGDPREIIKEYLR